MYLFKCKGNDWLEFDKMTLFYETKTLVLSLNLCPEVLVSISCTALQMQRMHAAYGWIVSADWFAVTVPYLQLLEAYLPSS